MDQRGDEIHTSSTEATGASREGVVRWVLVIGTLLAIALLTIIWVTGAFNQDGEDVHQNVGRDILEQQSENDAGQSTPMMPAPGDATASAAPSGDTAGETGAATPTAPATPGNAPAGDPRQDAQ